MAIMDNIYDHWGQVKNATLWHFGERRGQTLFAAGINENRQNSTVFKSRISYAAVAVQSRQVIHPKIGK